MRTALSTVQQTLTPESATILNRAISEASRRGHAQTTSLHVAAALLSSPSSPLRQACIRSHPNSSHPLQCRALELCFSVALDRLPTAQSTTAQFPEPSISNALMAALKRAQGHQRRGSPEQQQQPLLAVKVELEQFIISILDDPSVSRVMSEASFSSTAVKAALEQSIAHSSAPQASAQFTSRFPEHARRTVQLGPRSSNPPMFLGAQIAENSRLGFQRNLCPNPGLQGAGTLVGSQQSEDARKVLEVLVCNKKKRNPIVLGENGATNDVLIRELVQRIEKGDPHDPPEQLKGVQFIHIEKEIFSLCAVNADTDSVSRKLNDLNGRVESCLRHSGVIINLGDLKWLVDGGTAGVSTFSNNAKHVVTEIGQLVGRHGSTGRVWLIGKSTYEIYLRCLACHPSMESSWDLQPVPITAKRPVPSLLPRFGGQGNICSSVESLIPLGGVPSTAPALRRSIKDNSACHKMKCCPECMVNYEQELVFMEKEKRTMSSAALHIKSVDQGQQVIPWWLQTENSINGRKGSDMLQAKDQELVWDHKVEELQNKWNSTCQSMHPHFHVVQPNASGDESHISPCLSTHAPVANERGQREYTGNQLGVHDWPRGGRMLPLSFMSPWPSLLLSRCSVSPLSQTSGAGDQAHPLSSHLLTSIEKCDKSQQDGLGDHSCDPPSSLSGLCDACTSPVNPVRTELALGRTDMLFSPLGMNNIQDHKCTMEVHKERLKDLTECMTSSIGFPLKITSEVSVPCTNVGPLSFMPSDMASPWKSPREVSTPCTNGGSIGSVQQLFDQQCAESPVPFQNIDIDAFKRLSKGLEEKVGWQSEAVSAVTHTVMHCRSQNGKRRGVSRKADIWLLFLGPDRIGKRKIAAALAEIIFHGKDDFICIGLSCQEGGISSSWNLNRQKIDEYDFRFRGKTVLDRIAEAVRQNPFSVVLLEDVDQADSPVQSSLIHAMEKGRLPDSHGREVGLGNVIFIMTTNAGMKNDDHISKKETWFSEEKLLAARGWNMQILVDSARFEALISKKKRVSVANYEHDRETEESEQVGLSLGYSNKRKVDWINDEKAPDSSSENTKKMHKASAKPWDLNLSVEEIEAADDFSTFNGHTEACQGLFSHSSDLTVEHVLKWAGKYFEDLSGLVDKSVIFRPFDFDGLADRVVETISAKFSSIIGSEGLFEIDAKVLDQILATILLTLDGMKTFEEWVEQVFGSSLMEVSRTYTISADTVVKLVIDRKCFLGEQAPGVCLPRNISLNRGVAREKIGKHS